MYRPAGTLFDRLDEVSNRAWHTPVKWMLGQVPSYKPYMMGTPLEIPGWSMIVYIGVSDDVYAKVQA